MRTHVILKHTFTIAKIQKLMIKHILWSYMMIMKHEANKNIAAVCIVYLSYEALQSKTIKTTKLRKKKYQLVKHEVLNSYKRLSFKTQVVS